MKTVRICINCGRTYIATSGNQKYCTKSCRKAAYKPPKVKKADDELRRTVREEVMSTEGIKPYDYGKWRASCCISSTLGR